VLCTRGAERSGSKGKAQASGFSQRLVADNATQKHHTTSLDELGRRVVDGLRNHQDLRKYDAKEERIQASGQSRMRQTGGAYGVLSGAGVVGPRGEGGMRQGECDRSEMTQ